MVSGGQVVIGLGYLCFLVGLESLLMSSMNLDSEDYVEQMFKRSKVRCSDTYYNYTGCFCGRNERSEWRPSIYSWGSGFLKPSFFAGFLRS